MGLDLEKYRMRAGDQFPRAENCNRLPLKGRKYFRGPIPLSWLSAAANLPGRTLHVALAIWHIAHLTKGSQDVVLSRSSVEAFGVGRRSTREALARLESAGLVRVTRRHGRAPRVAILDVGENSA